MNNKIYYDQILSKNNSTSQTVNDIPELISLDYLVLTAVLLLSIGFSINRALDNRYENLEVNSNTNSQTENVNMLTGLNNKYQKRPLKIVELIKKKWPLMIAAGNVASPFVNTLALFGITAQIFLFDASIAFLTVGVCLGVILLYISGVFKVLTSESKNSYSHLLRKRYDAKVIFYITALINILRHFLVSAMSLHVTTQALSAIGGFSPFPVTVMLAIAATACASVGEINSGQMKGIGNIWVCVLALILICTVFTTTFMQVGVKQFWSTLQENDSQFLPSFSVSPFSSKSIWALICLGLTCCGHVFLLSTTAHKNFICQNQFSALDLASCTSTLIMLWVMLATWAGLACIVVYKNILTDFHQSTQLLTTDSKIIASAPPSFDAPETAVPQKPSLRLDTLRIRDTYSNRNLNSFDGILAFFVSSQLSVLKGFRGFFLACLLSAAVGGMSRRYNQVQRFVYDLYFIESESSKKTIEDIDLPEELLKELLWKTRQKKRCSMFIFKFLTGSCCGFFSVLAMVFMESYKINAWRIWQSLLGCLGGPLLGVAFIAMALPTWPHKGCVVGVVTGSMVNTIVLFLSWNKLNQNSSEFFDVGEIEYTVLSYCYIAPIGFLVCIISAFLFNVITRSFTAPSDSPLVLPWARVLSTRITSYLLERNFV